LPFISTLHPLSSIDNLALVITRDIFALKQNLVLVGPDILTELLYPLALISNLI